MQQFSLCMSYIDIKNGHQVSTSSHCAKPNPKYMGSSALSCSWSYIWSLSHDQGLVVNHDVSAHLYSIK